MTTLTAARWVIRPTMMGSRRQYLAVAILADGQEVVSGPKIGALPTVYAAREWIAKFYQGGTTFPPKPFVHSAAYFDTCEAIRERHWVAV